MTRKKFEVVDKELWDDVRASIAPIKGGRSLKPSKMLLSLTPLRVSAQIAPNVLVQHPEKSPPLLTGFDRRTAQRLGRGKDEPQARLDLHGSNLEDARFSLLQFLASRRAQGVRLVLVITGKGASPFARHTLHGQSHFHAPEREGKLRREVPRWLEEAQFRIHVIGFQPAHPRHGGGGAYYVRLRKHW